MSIAYNKPYPILDANVKRVISRYENINLEQKDAIKSLWSLSDIYTPSENVFEYTQGIMDLGATICQLRSPMCSECPLNLSCESAFKEFDVNKRNKRQKLTKRINFTLAHSNQSFLLFKKNEQSFWESLWIPYDNRYQDFERIFKEPRKTKTQNLFHPLSHIDLEITVKIFDYDKPFNIDTNLEHQWINKSQINDFGLPKPIKAIIDTYV